MSALCPELTMPLRTSGQTTRNPGRLAISAYLRGQGKGEGAGRSSAGRLKAPTQDSSSRKTSRLEDRFALQVMASGLPMPDREVRLIPGRRFRSDFVWPDARIVVEVDGGIWSGGRHTTGAGYTRDAEKNNLLTLAGWRVFHVTRGHIRSGQAVEWLRQAMEQERDAHGA